MKNILLPTDFSDNSWSAIVYALKLFIKTEATFFLLHSTAIPASTMMNLSRKLEESINKQARKDLEEFKDQMEAIIDRSDQKVEFILTKESMTEAIEKVVIQHSIDYIVMGTKGATAAQKIFFGSNTVRAIKHLMFCPLLIVPNEYTFRKPSQIAFPSDFNRFYNYKEIKPLKELAKLHDSAIRIVHINVEEHLDEIQEYNMTVLDEALDEVDHSFHWMPDYDKKTKEINVFIEDMEIDILAMVKYKHSLIDALIKEPIIKKIGFHPTIPFLVIPD